MLTGRVCKTQRSTADPRDLVVNDDKLCPPFALGDTLAELVQRLSGVCEGRTVSLRPGWDWAVIMSGLAGAISRYRSGLGTSNGIAARVAVGEALWWVASADEFLRKRISRGMKLETYSARVQETVAGRRLAGLVYLRNRAGHQLAAALALSTAAKSADFKIRASDGSVTTHAVTAHLIADLRPFDPSPSDGYFFTPSSSLPLSDAAFRETYHRDSCYDELVASRPVTDVLDATERSLNAAVRFKWEDSGIEVLINGAGTL